MSSKVSNDVRSRFAPTEGVKEGTKTLVRNCRSAPAAPVSGSHSKQRNKSNSSTSKNAIDKRESDEVNLTEPQLNSSLKIKDNLMKMKSGMKSVRFEAKVPTESRSKASKKVNIRFDEKIYKNLIDLKVSEDDLGLRPISSGKPKDLSGRKDPIPQLSDFYKPSFDKEYVVKPHPPTFKIKKLERPLGSVSSVLQAVKRWSVDDNKL